MKKRIKLLEKKIMLRLNLLQPEQEVELKSVDFVIAALEQNIENTKGLDRMVRIAGILDKIQKQYTENSTTLTLDDSDYLVIKDSVDKVQWGFMILHFPEFLDSIANPEKVE